MSLASTTSQPGTVPTEQELNNVLWECDVFPETMPTNTDNITFLRACVKLRQQTDPFWQTGKSTQADWLQILQEVDPKRTVFNSDTMRVNRVLHENLIEPSALFNAFSQLVLLSISHAGRTTELDTLGNVITEADMSRYVGLHHASVQNAREVLNGFRVDNKYLTVADNDAAPANTVQGTSSGGQTALARQALLKMLSKDCFMVDKMLSEVKLLNMAKGNDYSFELYNIFSDPDPVVVVTTNMDDKTAILTVIENNGKLKDLRTSIEEWLGKDINTL